MKLFAVLLVLVHLDFVASGADFSRRFESAERRLEKFRIKRDLHFRDVLNEGTQFVCASQRKKPLRRESITSPLSSGRVKRQVRTSNESPRDADVYGTAVAFSGGAECLKYSGSEALPNHQFSVGLWVKPEGGQHTPVSILGKSVASQFLSISAERLSEISLAKRRHYTFQKCWRLGRTMQK